MRWLGNRFIVVATSALDQFQSFKSFRSIKCSNRSIRSDSILRRRSHASLRRLDHIPSPARIAGLQFHVAQGKHLRIDVAMGGNSSLIAQHALAFDGKNKADQQFAGIGMGRALGQDHRMDIGDYRLVENILHRAALAFDARGDVGVGVGDDVIFAGSQKLRCDVVTVAHCRLLGGERLQKIARLVLAPAPLQADVPLRVLQIDADASLPTGRQQVFIFLWRFIGFHQLGVVGHGVEQRVDVDPMAVGIFEPFVIGRGFRRHEALG